MSFVSRQTAIDIIAADRRKHGFELGKIIPEKFWSTWSQIDPFSRFSSYEEYCDYYKKWEFSLKDKNIKEEE